jgi:hydrogenase maturation protease
MPEFASNEAARRLLIGAGNDFRSDDGVGRAIARGVAALGLPGLRVRECTGEGAELMDLWQGADEVVVVDAAHSGARPGTVVRFEASRERLPTGFFSYTTHAFSVAEAVETARALGTLPRNLVVYGVEGEAFGHGQHLSPCVAAAASRMVAVLLADFSRTTKAPETIHP